MSGLNFAPAVRSQAKARVAIIGPTGAGKTWTALEWATVLAAGGKVAVIDTENDSASLYSDQYHFDTAAWSPPYNVPKLVAAIAAAAATYDVVVIDSLTHFWQGPGGVLDIVDRAADKARGNSYVAWKEGTPVWRSLLDALVFAPCHMIVTMRSKMEYVQTEVDGKKKIEKMGMAPIARNDVEYEFTVVGDMDQSHRMTITKSRCADLADQSVQAHQSEKLAVILRDWLSSANPAPPRQPPTDSAEGTTAPRMISEPQIKKMMACFNDLGIKAKPDRLAFIAAAVRDVESSKDLTIDEAKVVIDLLEKRIANQQQILPGGDDAA